MVPFESPTPSRSVARMTSISSGLRATLPEGEEIGRALSPAGKVAKASKAPSRRVGGRIGDAHHQAGDTAHLANDYEMVKHRYKDVLKENEALKGEQRRRMESYMRRETNYQAEIEDLKAELERSSRARPPEDERMSTLRMEHRKVMDKLGCMHQREQSSLQEQEHDLLRAFRARLWDVQFELENERSKKDDGALEWVEKTRTLGKELDWSRGEALRLDRVNQTLSRENAALRTQLRSQERLIATRTGRPNPHRYPDATPTPLAIGRLQLLVSHQPWSKLQPSRRRRTTASSLCARCSTSKRRTRSYGRRPGRTSNPPRSLVRSLVQTAARSRPTRGAAPHWPEGSTDRALRAPSAAGSATRSWPKMPSRPSRRRSALTS